MKSRLLLGVPLLLVFFIFFHFNNNDDPSSATVRYHPGPEVANRGAAIVVAPLGQRSAPPTRAVVSSLFFSGFDPDEKRKPAGAYAAVAAAAPTKDERIKKALRILHLSARASFSSTLLSSSDCSDKCVGLSGEDGICDGDSAITCAAFVCAVNGSTATDQLPVCGGAEASQQASSLLLSKEEVERQIKRLVSERDSNGQHWRHWRKFQQKASSLARGACSLWQRSKINSLGWQPGRQLRSLLSPPSSSSSSSNSSSYSNMQRAVDCCLPLERGFVMTAHHREEPLGKFAAEQNEDIAAYLTSALSFSPQRGISDVVSHLLDVSAARSSKKLTEMQRVRRAPWIAIQDVCMRCEPSRDPSSSPHPTFLNPKRACATTLYSFENRDRAGGRKQKQQSHASGLAAKSRGGRHSIFVLREAAFIYGGDVDALLERMSMNNHSSRSSEDDDSTLHFVPGTTFYAGPFSVSNVGHQIHDGILGFAGALLSRHVLVRAASNSKIAHDFPAAPRPWRVMLDSDHFETSASFYGFVTAALAVSAFSSETTDAVSASLSNKSLPDDYFSAASARNDVVDDEGSRLFVFDHRHQKRSEKQKKKTIYCFEQLIVSGTTRSSSTTKIPALLGVFDKAAVSALVRASVFNYISKRYRNTTYPAVPPLPSPPLLSQKMSRFVAPPVSGPASRRSLRVAVYGRSDVYRRRIDNIGALVSATRDAMDAAQQEAKRSSSSSSAFSSIFASPWPTLITTFYSSPLSQIVLATQVDVLVTVSGAHEQPMSLFGPADMSIVEIATCLGTQTSFVGRYGMLMPEHQRLTQVQVCAPLLNVAESDTTEQSLTLCPHHLELIRTDIKQEILRIAKLRQLV